MKKSTIIAFVAAFAAIFVSAPAAEADISWRKDISWSKHRDISW